ncbi:hypothetical protein E2C01_005593 [Portunus trituberculatus]|uniref:Uncharacterized protein n=1 Tax=Portunus trituberculatus TaxID=210409 RepID=A0A5B7CUQ4_PORTR|nr:hypothetical protein [Portunus trituberculatus]
MSVGLITRICHLIILLYIGPAGGLDGGGLDGGGGVVGGGFDGGGVVGGGFDGGVVSSGHSRFGSGFSFGPLQVSLSAGGSLASTWGTARLQRTFIHLLSVVRCVWESIIRSAPKPRTPNTTPATKQNFSRPERVFHPRTVVPYSTSSSSPTNPLWLPCVCGRVMSAGSGATGTSSD